MNYFGGPLIEVYGGGFRNKGAELMLRTVVDEIRDRIPTARWAINVRTPGAAERRAIGALDVIWRHPGKIPAIATLHNKLTGVARRLPSYTDLVPDRGPPRTLQRALDWLISLRAAGATHSVLASEIDALFDISGFAYGDTWGSASAARSAEYFEVLKRSGAVIVLFPQQLGPFRKPVVREAFLRLYGIVDLVYARDDLSYSAVAEVVPDTGKLLQAPDFTTRKAASAEFLQEVDGRACIVPNSKMLTHGRASAQSDYPQFLKTCVKVLKELGTDPFFLVHDTTGGDADLVRALQLAGCEIDSVVEENAYNSKEILGRCFLTVGSRFHGLVSALSQGVPSLATGWSHKYPMLLAEYGVPECLMNIAAPEDQVRSALLRLVNPVTREPMIQRLKEAEELRIHNTELMWGEVIRLLNYSDSAAKPVRN